MIESIHFRNFKILKNATLPLQPFTLLIGPNSSGKSTALEGLDQLSKLENANPSQLRSIDCPPDETVEVSVKFDAEFQGVAFVLAWNRDGRLQTRLAPPQPDKGLFMPIEEHFRTFRTFSFDAEAIGRPAPLQENLEMRRTGGGLAAVLDRLRDLAPERFEELDRQLSNWFPEFDRIVFQVQGGQKSFSLRRTGTQTNIPALQLAEGTRFALAILTLAYLPSPPRVVGIEEPERGVHPRLLQDIHKALHRLSHPHEFGESRDAIQVIATSHSPYFLDLFKDFPDEVVIAQRDADGGASFTPLVQIDHLRDILGDATLGEAWFTGVLGGVPSAK